MWFPYLIRFVNYGVQMVWNYQVDMQVFQIDTFCQKNNFFLAQITFSCFGKYHKNFLSHVTFDIQLFWNIPILARDDNKNRILGCLKSRFYHRFWSSNTIKYYEKQFSNGAAVTATKIYINIIKNFKILWKTFFERYCGHCNQNISKYHQKP